MFESATKAFDRLGQPTAPPAVIPPSAPASSPAAVSNPQPSAAQPSTDRLSAIESRLGQQEGRLLADEAAIGAVNDLTLKLGAGTIRGMSTRGHQNSPACQAYLAWVRQGGTPGNPPKGCRQ
jgi:hypothetical protein